MSMTSSERDMQAEAARVSGGPLARLDGAMASSAWLPRVVPFFLWIAVMAVSGALVRPYAPGFWPVVYGLKCVAVGWLLWRYRRWIREVNWRFHWLALPTAVGLVLAWIALGWWMAGEFGARFEALLAGEPIGLMAYPDAAVAPGLATTTPGFFASTLYDHPLPGLFAVSVTLKLIGMALIVPMFEELFTRSALLRALNKWPLTKQGLMQFACDLPLIGDQLMHTRAGYHATQQPPAFTRQLETTPVGALGVSGVVLTTLLFAGWHAPRDWPGAVACGVVWCGLLWWTNRGEPKLGLGPIIWSHALTNALLWAYTLATWDWQFL